MPEKAEKPRRWCSDSDAWEPSVRPVIQYTRAAISEAAALPARRAAVNSRHFSRHFSRQFRRRGFAAATRYETACRGLARCADASILTTPNKFKVSGSGPLDATCRGP